MSWQTLATQEQLTELTALATELGEEIPPGLHANEAQQRLDELRRRAARGHVLNQRGSTRPVEDVQSSLL